MSMNDLEALKAAIKRRGYAFVERTHTEFPNMIILWIARDDGRPVETSPGVQRVVWARDLKVIRRDLGEHMVYMLSSMSGGQRHMVCRCGEPLLQAKRQASVPVVRHDGHPMPYLTGDVLQATITEYRQVSAGPNSPALSVCPKCQSRFSEATVKEIEDK